MAKIAEFFIEGGIWMVPIAFLSMVVVAVAVERMYYLLFLYSEDGEELMNKVKRFVQSGQLDQAAKACDVKPTGILSRLVKKGLLLAEASPEEIKTGIEEATFELVPLVQKRGNSLAGLASLATLLGLLGTVMGLIEAFTVVADAPPDQKSVLLTKAISVAMNCTAFGLIVAIPAMFFQMMVGGAMKKVLDDVDTGSMKLENWLVARRQGAKNVR